MKKALSLLLLVMLLFAGATCAIPALAAPADPPAGNIYIDQTDLGYNAIDATCANATVGTYTALYCIHAGVVVQKRTVSGGRIFYDFFFVAFSSINCTRYGSDAKCAPGTGWNITSSVVPDPYSGYHTTQVQTDAWNCYCQAPPSTNPSYATNAGATPNYTVAWEQTFDIDGPQYDETQFYAKLTSAQLGQTGIPALFTSPKSVSIQTNT